MLIKWTSGAALKATKNVYSQPCLSLANSTYFGNVTFSSFSSSSYLCFHHYSEYKFYFLKHLQLPFLPVGSQNNNNHKLTVAFT